MAKFTFLELHLEGSSLAANSPFSTGESDAESTAESVPEPEQEADAESGGRRGVAVVIGLVFLVAVALAVRKWMAEDEEIVLG